MSERIEKKRVCKRSMNMPTAWSI